MHRSLLVVAALVGLASPAAHAFTLGAEIGGQTTINSKTLDFNESGGQLALLLGFDIVDDADFHLQILGRGETGIAVFQKPNPSIAGRGGIEGLLRAGLNLSVLEPFAELGLGTSLAGPRADVGVLSLEPEGYAGIGLTLRLPLLPYFEARAGMHGGIATDALGPRFIPDDPYFGRFDVHLGAGFHF